MNSPKVPAKFSDTDLKLADSACSQVFKCSLLELIEASEKHGGFPANIIPALIVIAKSDILLPFKNKTSIGMPGKAEEIYYIVYATDNFHSMDDEKDATWGTYKTNKEALDVCRKIVDDFLIKEYELDMLPDKLYEIYAGFGEAPYIVTNNKNPEYFHHRDYAHKRCIEICEARIEDPWRGL